MRRIILIILTALYIPSFAIQPPSVLVKNISKDEIVINNNASVVRPMASITKLMTAMVVLDLFDLEQKIRLGKKDTMTVEQLLTNVLVRSDNGASELLAKNHPRGRNAFLDAMNSKAKFLGLKTTEYHDASGLSPDNLTTAQELAKVVAYAGTYPFIRNTSTLIEITKTRRVKNQVRKIVLPNTNKDILFEFDNILVSKTGTTNKAGKCLAMLVDNKGEQYAIIILGEPNKQIRDRLARNLLEASNSPKR